MEDKDLLTLLIAFVLGYFSHQIMENMFEGRLVEGLYRGSISFEGDCKQDWSGNAMKGCACNSTMGGRAINCAEYHYCTNNNYSNNGKSTKACFSPNYGNYYASDAFKEAKGCNNDSDPSCEDIIRNAGSNTDGLDI
tara:strand:+ start:1924 stop:2334 length:411 start_codon:yes stop_codon:yes gene_type:complete